jgi:hypothetical protein
MIIEALFSFMNLKNTVDISCCGKNTLRIGTKYSKQASVIKSKMLSREGGLDDL